MTTEVTALGTSAPTPTLPLSEVGWRTDVLERLVQVLELLHAALDHLRTGGRGSKGAASCAASWGGSCGGRYAAAAAAPAVVLQATASQGTDGWLRRGFPCKTCPCGSSCWQGGNVMTGLAARCWSTAALWCAGTCTASARSRSPAPEVKGRLESAGVGLWAAGQPHLLDDRADILGYERALLGVALHLHRSHQRAKPQRGV